MEIKHRNFEKEGLRLLCRRQLHDLGVKTQPGV